MTENDAVVPVTMIFPPFREHPAGLAAHENHRNHDWRFPNRTVLDGGNAPGPCTVGRVELSGTMNFHSTIFSRTPRAFRLIARSSGPDECRRGRRCARNRHALNKLASRANAPIFTYDDSYLDGAIVGGPMFSMLEGSRIATDVATRILDGERQATSRPHPSITHRRNSTGGKCSVGGSANATFLGGAASFRPPSAWETIVDRS